MNQTVLKTRQIKHDLIAVIGGLKATLENLPKDPSTAEVLLRLSLKRLTGILSQVEKKETE
jgi:hypothetical protein